MNLNKVSLIGNLTVDPTERTLPTGQAFASITVATTYRWKDSESKERERVTEFHPVVAFGRLATIIAKYVKKGDRVYLEGRIQTREWRGKDNARHFRSEVVASQLIMLGGKSKSRTSETAAEVSTETTK